MGGCRCLFRDCDVSSTRYPGLTCFHFPVKDDMRFKKWVEMSGATFLLELPVNQQRSRVICARHFRDECFMNYKKERLLRDAVPTLLRFNDKFALDYELLDEDGNPMTVILAKPKSPHLIPPPDFQCPLQLHRMVLPKSRAPDSTTPEVPAKKAKLDVKQLKKRNTLTFTIESHDDESFKFSVNDASNAADLISASPVYESEEHFSTHAVESNRKSPFSSLSSPSPQFEDVFIVDEISICEENKCVLTPKSPMIAKHVELEQEVSELKTENARLQSTEKTLRAELASLTEEYAALRERYEEPARIAKQPSKASIFTSMKKYVSASMVPLLRMDMFGSADRPWKADERRTAVELLQLGENIYKHFCSEWRVRLPTIREVREWIANGEAEPEEEEL